MHLTGREFWTVVHGMVLGALFLLAFSGGFAELYGMRSDWLTVAGTRKRMGRLVTGTVAMAVVGWLTVYAGTYIVYPWYRAPAPKGLVAAAAAPAATENDFRALDEWPKASLLIPARDRAEWHNFGMEWKEHVAFFCPILATAVAFVVVRYRRRLPGDLLLRRAVLTLFVLAFATAALAGTLGAFINKVAPIR